MVTVRNPSTSTGISLQTAKEIILQYFLHGYHSSSLTETMWNTWNVSLPIWNHSTGESPMEGTTRKKDTYIREDITDADDFVLPVVKKWEICNDRLLVRALLVIQGWRYSWRGTRTWLEQTGGKDTLQYLIWVSGEREVFWIMPVHILLIF